MTIGAVRGARLRRVAVPGVCAPCTMRPCRALSMALRRREPLADPCTNQINSRHYSPHISNPSPCSKIYGTQRCTLEVAPEPYEP